MNPDREIAHPLRRVGQVPMIHWENGRACAGPAPARSHPAPATSNAPGDAVPSPLSSPPGDATEV
jgi:hypothetical protein